MVEKLFGREDQLQILRQGLNKIRAGERIAFLISGDSGSGKTVLVKAAFKDFCYGKFEQIRNKMPYSPILQALRQLIIRCLQQDPESCRDKILDGVSIKQTILEVFPDLQSLLGEQPEIPTVGSLESNNRFNLVIAEFITVFANHKNPIILFLDDVQWADIASLKLIELLREIPYLMLILAYRESEFDRKTVLTDQRIQAINCSPLTEEQLTEMVAMYLNSSQVNCKELGKWLHTKSRGNPFFVKEKLDYLYSQQLLQYIESENAWTWTEDNTDLAGLIEKKIEALSTPVKDLLTIAACIGSTFDLDIVIKVLKLKEPPDQELSELILAKLIIKANETEYCFRHDIIRQVAYQRIPPKDKQEKHGCIGQILYQENKDIFDICNQLNLGTSSIQGIELVRLNLDAGIRCKISAAYQSSCEYLQKALEALPADAWETHYCLAVKLHIESLESEYLIGNVIEAERILNTIKCCATKLDLIKAHEKQILVYCSQNKMLEALDISFEALEKLGINLSTIPPENIGINKLIEKPPTKDEKIISAQRLLMLSMPPAYIAKSECLASISYTMMNLCIWYGNCEVSPYAYGLYALILCGMGDIELGYQFGSQSVELVENKPELMPKVFSLFNIFVRHWKDPVKTTIKPLEIAVEKAVELGDLAYAGYNALSVIGHHFFCGEPLEKVANRQTYYSRLSDKIHQQHFSFFISVFQQIVSDLRNHNTFLNGDIFNNNMIPQLRDNLTSLFCVYLARLILYYIFKDYPQALKNADLAQGIETSVTGTIYIVQYKFYAALAILSKPELSQLDWERVEAIQEQIKQWLNHSKINCQHKYDLISAEMARASNQPLRAIQYYDRSIKEAAESGYLCEEAIALEKASEFYRSLGNSVSTKFYLEQAYERYKQWNATTKLRQLEQEYPELEKSTEGNVQSVFISKILQTWTKTQNFSDLIENLLQAIQEKISASKTLIILDDSNQIYEYPESVIQQVKLTQKNISLTNPRISAYASDPYICKYSISSLLAIPLFYDELYIGTLYLENYMCNTEELNNLKVALPMWSTCLAISKTLAKTQQLEAELIYSNFMKQSITELRLKGTFITGNLRYLEQHFQTLIYLVQKHNISHIEYTFISNEVERILRELNVNANSIVSVR